ncbi:uncharacterized protein [Dermacentor andersoni]|uniref:uncharacterized protein isoform X2 n=1 Tax=Dermacentor andersoni TaxID=34620 RepID=UPI003B3AD264
MKTQCRPTYVICLLALFWHGNSVQSNKTEQHDKEEFVKKLIGGQQRLIISKSIYFRYDYPICVESHLILHSEAGYRHNVFYFDKKKEGAKDTGEANRTVQPRKWKATLTTDPQEIQHAYFGGEILFQKRSERPAESHSISSAVNFKDTDLPTQKKLVVSQTTKMNTFLLPKR